MEYRFTIVGRDKTRAAFKSIRSGLGKLRGAVNSTQVKMAGLAGVAGVGALVNSSRQSIDVLAKQSDVLGITTEKLAALGLAAELTGSSQDALEKGIKKLGKSIVDAGNGLTTYTRAFDALKLNPDELKALTPDEQFQRVAESLANVETQTERVALAYDLFGGRNTALLNTLNLVGTGFEDVERQARELGLSISRVDAAKVEEANDQLTRVGSAVKGLGNRLTVQLAPVISVVSEQFIKAASNGDNLGKIVTKSIGGAIKVVGIFADGVRGIKVIFGVAKVAAVGFARAVTGVFEGIGNAVVGVSNGIRIKFLESLRSVVEIAARFSDTAKEALADINRQISTPPPTPAFLATVQAANESLTMELTKTRNELQELLLADLPSAVLEQRWAEIQAEAEQRAKETAARIEERLAAGPAEGVQERGETELEAQKRQEKEAREREALARRLEALDFQNATELEKLRIKYQEELEIINAAEAAKLEIEGSFDDRRLKAKEKFEAAQRKLDKTSIRGRLSLVAGGLSDILGTISQGNQKAFKFTQGLALAEAAVAVPQAVTKAIANAGGLPFGAWAGALTAAKGVAQIAAIKKQRLGGGGGSVPSVSGGGGGAPAFPAGAGASALASPGFGTNLEPNQAAQAATTVVNFEIAGDVVGDTAETVLEKMRTLLEDNDAVLFNADSRQAQEIAG